MGGLALVLVSIATAVHAGCGSDEVAPITGADASPAAIPTATSPSEPDPQGGPDDGAAPASADGGLDGSRDAALVGVDGGAPPSPGAIACGSGSCNAATQTCCRTLDGGASCTATGQCSGASVACDEKADCQGGAICCAGLGGRGAARCDAKCGRFDTQLCRTNAECGDGVCYVNSCLGGVVIQACEKLIGCQQ